MRPDDVTLLPSLSAPAVHPDGTWAVVGVAFPSLVADAYPGQLWRVDLSGATPPRRLTRGFRDSAPAFSPDGALLAFVRSTPEGRPQLHVMPATGGEPVAVTDAKLGVGAFDFSPDGRRLVYATRVPDDGRYGSLEGVAPAAEDPRHITTLQFQANGLGWSSDRRAHLFVVDVPDPWGEVYVTPVGRAAKAIADAKLAAAASDPDTPVEGPTPVPVPRRLTEGDFDHGSPVFTPDGHVLATSARHEGRDADLLSEVFRYDPDGAADPEAVSGGVNAHGACVAADGTLFLTGADLGPSHRDFVGKQGGVFVVPADGGEPRRITDAETIEISGGLEPYGSHGVVTLLNDRGTGRAVTVGADGTVDTWPSGDASIHAAVALPGDPDRLVVTYATPTVAAEIGLLDRSGALTPLSDFSAPLREARVAEPIELTATASDGHPVHGWVYLPEGEGPHPVLLTIHGGPHSSYGPAFFDEFQVFTAAGYAVVACNPRGSAGYGLEHGRSIKGAMGTVDASDILSFLDHALANVDGLDAERVGVQGGSYGGYMTAWLIGHTDRFAAAIVERGYLDPHSFVGASDIGWFFIAEYSGDPQTWDAQSPMAFVNEVRTPTLVIHSEQDLRCPLGPALRYYTQLKQNGVDAELLVFPGENHELSRSGTPWHRKQRFDAILDWWSRHLPVRG